MKIIRVVLISFLLTQISECRISIHRRPNRRHTPESKKLQINIPSDTTQGVNMIRDEGDVGIVEAEEQYGYYNKKIHIHSIPQDSPTPISSENSLQLITESEKAEAKPALFEEAFPEEHTNYARDQTELRNKLMFMASLNRKYKNNDYIEITKNELTDINTMIEELISLREMSQNYGTKHEICLQMLRGDNETSQSSEIEIDEKIIEKTKKEMKDKDEDEDSEPSKTVGNFNSFLNKQAEALIIDMKSGTDLEVLGTGTSAGDADKLQELAKLINKEEEEKSPNFEELSAESKEIKKSMTEAQMKNINLMVRALGAEIDDIFDGTPLDLTILDNLTAQNHKDTEEMFDHVDKIMGKTMSHREQVDEKLHFIFKHLNLLPNSKSRVLKFYDVYEDYTDTLKKFRAKDYECQAKNYDFKEIIKDFKPRKKALIDLTHIIKNLMIGVEVKGEELADKQANLKEEQGVDTLDDVQMLDLINDVMRNFIKTYQKLTSSVIELRENIDELDQFGEKIKRNLGIFDQCASS